MRLAEKLLSRAGKAPSAGADRDPPAAARAITAPAKADEADAGGVLTFGDVASARGSDAAADTAARWSAGAVKRVGSITFAAPKRGVPDATGAGGEKRARGAPRGAEHVDFPADWTPKTHVKFTSTAPLRWAAAASGGPEASDGGVRAFAGARARADPDRPPARARGGGNGASGGGALRAVPLPRRETETSTRTFCPRASACARALCAWTYPADPMAPELVAALRALPGAAGKQWLERRLDDGWREALLGAYAATRVGDCPFFYVVFPERVALFRAPAGGARFRKRNDYDDNATSHDDVVSHAAGGFAVVTEASSGKFRDALVAARVPHACVGADPRARARRTGGGASPAPAAAGADGDGRGHGGAYGHGILLEEGRGLAEAYKDEADFQALDAPASLGCAARAPGAPATGAAGAPTRAPRSARARAAPPPCTRWCAC